MTAEFCEPDPDVAYKEQIENPGPTIREQATALVVLKVLTDRVAAAKRAIDADVKAKSEAGDRVAAKLPDGTEIGAVTVAHGRRQARVIDGESLTSWVSEHCPDQVQVIHETRVRPAFLTALLKTVIAEGGWLDKSTGEIYEVDGVQVYEGDPYLLPKPSDHAAELIERAWRNGDIDIRAAITMAD